MAFYALGTAFYGLKVAFFAPMTALHGWAAEFYGVVGAVHGVGVGLNLLAHAFGRPADGVGTARTAGCVPCVGRVMRMIRKYQPLSPT